MSVRMFWNDEIINPDADWGKPYLRRTVWEVKTPLPSALGFSEIASESVKTQTRLECFLSRLADFRLGYSNIVRSIEAVMPADDMRAQWPHCALSLCTEPLLAKFPLLLEPNEDHPELEFVRAVVSDWKAQDDAPPDLLMLARVIWREMKENVELLTGAFELVKVSDQVHSQLRNYAAKLRAGHA
jgi:hypothetical protein